MTAERDHERALQLAQRAADDASLAALEGKMYDLAAGTLDKSRAAATTLQGSASAVGVLYAGVLGLIFSAGGTSLPFRGIVPSIFLGASIVLSTAYVAFLTTTRSNANLGEGQGREGVTLTRINFFIEYVGELVGRRAALMRCGVVALAVGLATVPIPFVTIPADWPSTWPREPLASGLVILLGGIIVTTPLWKQWYRSIRRTTSRWLRRRPAEAPTA